MNKVNFLDLNRQIIAAPATIETPEATASETPEATKAPETPEVTSEVTAAPASIPAPEATSEAPTSATLPAGYLANGSMIDADGVMLPEYIGEYAEGVAQRLKSLKASTFQRAFLKKTKEANKMKVPYSAKKNCAQGMVIAALKLVSRKKDPAPRVLLDMIRAATATVVDDATFDVLYMHLDAIYTNLLVG